MRVLRSTKENSESVRIVQFFESCCEQFDRRLQLVRLDYTAWKKIAYSQLKMEEEVNVNDSMKSDLQKKILMCLLLMF